RSQRRGPQALEAKGYRPSARRVDSFAALASWRNGAWAQAARLQLCAAEEDVAGRVALGAIREARGTEIDRGRCLGAGDPQVESIAFDARQAKWREVRVAGRLWRKSQPGVGQPQPRAREAGSHQRFAAVR